MSGKLYVVGTPIGNLGDLSPRAVEVLSAVDFIAAEDTRVTLKLLNHFEIKKSLISYFEHNKYDKGDQILDRIQNGETAAIVTDAGMPAISDPGEDLVREARSRGIEVESVPGPCAFATALAISGMPSGKFCFEGFLPADKKERRQELESVKSQTRTLIYYEAPHKLKRTLADMLEILGDREIALCKELTKLHESVVRTSLSDALGLFAEAEPKGEFVIIVKGAEESAPSYTLDDAVSIAKALMKEGLSASAAAKEAAGTTGIKKGDIYKFIIS